MAVQVKRGTTVVRRDSNTRREGVGFTTKPDGIRRARLVTFDGNETRVKADQITKTYKIL